MVFDNYECSNAEGVILAHTVRMPGLTLKKGRVLCAADLAALQDNGILRISGVRLEADDVDEDQAALEMARALAGPSVAHGQPVAGRCYLYALSDGLALVNRAVIDAINLCDVGIFIATLPEYAECLHQQAVASIKVIPFAVPRRQLDRCLKLIGAGGSAIAVQWYKPRTVALLLTETAGFKESLHRSTSAVTHQRVTAMGAQIIFEKRCAHVVEELTSLLTEALAEEVDLVLICGASVSVDPSDIVPSAIVSCGGEIDHFGMPVEPGNMLLLGHVGACPVINLPGCSRSPKLNGLDWVMQRMAAGLPMGKSEILTMGVGGLIKDISHRWRMREQGNLIEQLQTPHKVAALILGAGSSSRMGGVNKLLLKVGGVPMLQRVVDAALGAELASVTVVTGCQADEVRHLLQGRDVRYVHNDAYREGIAGSLKLGLSSLPEDIDGVMILLADMPFIEAAHLNELIAEFNPAIERDIVAPLREGRLGNPIIWSSRYIPAMMNLSGDGGARPLLHEFAANVWEVPMGDDAIFLDVDTPEALGEANRRCEMNEPVVGGDE
ncbi:MAG: molybdopterin-binding/glycosyltransferase family 2 protein [Haliea sp.]|uniref:molybdopterin-binding/glycosyltransferase family 2 protein n=1 Tax=Haliea sp. TaxID=1932666 RepID=UPI0032EAF05E